MHCCRDDGYGGTSIYIKNQLKYNVLNVRSIHFFDLITIYLPDVQVENKPLVITSLYRSQKCSFDMLLRDIENLLLIIQNTSCIFVGDVNINLGSMNLLCRRLINTFAEFNFNL